MRMWSSILRTRRTWGGVSATQPTVGVTKLPVRSALPDFDKAEPL